MSVQLRKSYDVFQAHDAIGFVPPAPLEPPLSEYVCNSKKGDCCDAIKGAQIICEIVGSADDLCAAAKAFASSTCSEAAAICGYNVAHDCFGG